MRRGKKRQEHRPFHGCKNAKLGHLIRDMRNCRGATQLFSQICAAYATPHEQLKRDMREPGAAWDSESGLIELATASTRPARSGDEEDLLRVRILDLATGLVASHIDVTAVGIVRTENVPGFARNRLRHRELRRRI
jgi:hypothetical protein